jgi:hypothetical protein
MKNVTLSAPFFPFHPRALRWRLLAVALLGLVLAARALADSLGQGGFWGWLSTSFSLFLVGGLVFFYTRLRPRPDWGVRLLPTALSISLPLRGELTLPWKQVSKVSVLRKGKYLQVSLATGPYFLIPRAMFESKKVFFDMVQAIEERAPRPPFDA